MIMLKSLSTIYSETEYLWPWLEIFSFGGWNACENEMKNNWGLYFVGFKPFNKRKPTLFVDRELKGCSN